MIEKKISSLIVVKGQTVTGIVTTNDLLRVLLESHDGKLSEVTAKVRSTFLDSPIGTSAFGLLTPSA